ncbi:hypothetical protein J9A50_27025 [Klebsiella pneumoniae]|nr:hypothetical protein [Klebsiella pneumoniae]
MTTDITELAQREKFEAWFKSSFHPDKTGPYIKDQLYFAWKAAGAEMVEALEKAQQRIAELESRTVKLPKAMSIDGGAYCSAHAHYDSDGDYYDRADVEEMLSVAGIKVEAD